ncbi:hypothetical protein HF576_20040 [Microbacterium sp. CFH 90308]|uniref:Polyketide cyclase/dehydrase/lipid transport protein n=1 Tax=Microbacterium salsuginis TaxID=2722803 RepID=A0ABX1KGD4_9MICO|nr:SRPBCC family protein [Microbacterium sp. CFH 90308]NLP86129.1 hypothetical protein [Microbacterium sp. CFH 90308]
MTLLSEHSRITRHTPAAVFALWSDPRTWSTWDPEVRAVESEPPCAVGARGRLRPAKGPALTFTVTALLPDELFTDTARLPGARLEFEHLVAASGEGSRISVTVRVRGPLAGVWRRVLRSSMGDAARTGVEGLVAHLDGASPRDRGSAPALPNPHRNPHPPVEEATAHAAAE